MSRRRRLGIGIFIALALILFLPFFIPDKPPPFKFLREAHLRYASVSAASGSRVCTSSYFTQGSPVALAGFAKAELKGWAYRPDPSLDSHEFSQGNAVLTIVGWNFGTDAEPITHILYDLPPDFIDKIRSPVHKIGSWLPL